MAVAFDAVGPDAAGASTLLGSSASWSHTCTGADRLLIVGVAVGNGTDTGISASATYNSLTMDSVGLVHSNNSTAGWVQLFKRIAPTTGANTVVVTASGSVHDISAGSVSFTGVDQTTPLGAPVPAFGPTAPPSVVVTGTTAGNMVIDAVCNGKAITSSSQTNRWLRNTSTNNAAGNGASSTAAAGGSVTMSYTVTDDWWGAIAVEVLAVASGVTTDWLYAGSDTDVTSTWAGEASAVGSTTGDYATWTEVGVLTGTVSTLEMATFNAQTAVTAGSTISSVAIRVRHSEDPTAQFSGVTAQAYVGTTAKGSPQALTLSTTVHEDTITVTGLTYADLADLRVRVVATKN